VGCVAENVEAPFLCERDRMDLLVKLRPRRAVALLVGALRQLLPLLCGFEQAAKQAAANWEKSKIIWKTWKYVDKRRMGFKITLIGFPNEKKK